MTSVTNVTNSNKSTANINHNNPMSYSTSTQINNWIFSTDKIASMRDEVNENTRKEYLAKNPTEKNILSILEEQQLICYYEYKIAEISKVLNLPDKVAATGIIYLKRFFLKNSVMKVSPKLIMICCLYLACKTEDSHVEIDFYANGVGVTANDIIDLEIPILESLNFNLIVYHPYRPLHGYLMDIYNPQSKVKFNNNNMTFDQMWEMSRNWVQKSLYTDLPLQYHPFIIALACLSLSYGQDNFKTYIEYKSQQLQIDTQSESYQNTLLQIEHIKSLLSKVELIDKNIVKPIDRKLIFLNNPEKQKKASKKESSKKPTKKKLKSAPSSTVTVENVNTEPIKDIAME
ncbi:putative H-type cyclin [Tieghemostelium lacteum]|uniref:Putative H-type cyclin n=1 Tax=Tieghemostelium lacteum TaxID=361077 RepID=A0A151Z8M5_TIELA|nr:putative H-type cyclin [Tieghemostelium lacteum]|eukprot:KYQ90291.1 putative H-type cyclin [Tieghemostelium lacteum]